MTDVLTNIEQYLHERLDARRLQHSRNTAKVAVELARKYGADEQKALVAGLLHDVAKGFCRQGMLNVAEQYHVDADEMEKASPELLHGKLGAAMVKTDLGISDDEILSAIRWHTTGRANMSLLEKIIYLADLIEPSREFAGIDEIRKLAYQDIDEAMLVALKQVMDFVKGRGFMLHPSSMEAYQYIENIRRNIKA